MTLSAAAYFLLPFDLALTLLQSVLPKLLMLNIGGMIIIGLVLRRDYEQFENTKKLMEYAQTDSLTSLLNRRGVNAEIDAADVRSVDERLCGCISRQAFTYDDMTFYVSISVGAFWSKDNISI